MISSYLSVSGSCVASTLIKNRRRIATTITALNTICIIGSLIFIVFASRSASLFSVSSLWIFATCDLSLRYSIIVLTRSSSPKASIFCVTISAFAAYLFTYVIMPITTAQITPAPIEPSTNGTVILPIASLRTTAITSVKADPQNNPVKIALMNASIFAFFLNGFIKLLKSISYLLQ